MVDHLKRGLDLDFTAGAPQVAYRETISKDLQWTYAHKQRWQFARVTLRFSPLGQGAGLKIENACTGGTLPAAFFPGAEAGVRRACQRGTYAEIPLTDLKVTLVDADYHAADSSAATFEIAASACVREALPNLRPVLLEPVMLVVVVTPQDYLGDVIGDLNSRRGVVRSMDTLGQAVSISAAVPFANMFGYISTLRSMTRGRADYVMAFAHYEQVPGIPPSGDGPFAPAMALR